jgi:hypothetical protein
MDIPQCSFGKSLIINKKNIDIKFSALNAERLESQIILKYLGA